MRNTRWAVGIVALLGLLGLLLTWIWLPSQPETTTTTSRSAWSTTTENTTRHRTSTSASETTSQSTTTELTYKYNLTVLSFEVQVYNYTYDKETSSGQALLSWVLTATSATDHSFTAGVKQYRSAEGGKVIGFYKMLLKPGESSVLPSDIFNVSFAGSQEEMLDGDRSFKVVFSFPPEEGGHSVGLYKAKIIYFNLSGDWNVFVLRPSE